MTWISNFSAFVEIPTVSSHPPKPNNSDYVGSDKQPRVADRAKRFARSDKTASSVPIVGVPGPREVSHMLSIPGNLVVGIIVLFPGAVLRIRHGLANSDVSQSSGNSISFVFYVGLSHIVAGASAVENGIVGGIGEFYRGGYPPWALWVAILGVYGFILWYFDIRSKDHEQILAK